MIINNFLRFTETIKVKEAKRVVSVTVKPTISDCAGTIYFTDLQLQEGGTLSGYTLHTAEMQPPAQGPLHWHNGIVRSSATVILFNLGETSAALDCYLYPLQGMQPGSISLSQGAGSHRMTFLDAPRAGDVLALIASERRCLRNGTLAPKHGFYQYTAAYDSKHQVMLEQHKAARVYFEYREAREGDARP